MSAGPINPYAAPDAPVLPRDEPAEVEARAGRRWFALHAALWLMIAGLLALVVPKVMAIFADFGIPLSTTAQAVAALSRWATGNVVLASIILVAILATDRAILRGSDRPSRRWGPGFLLTLPPLAIWLATCWAVFSGIADLLVRLSG